LKVFGCGNALKQSEAVAHFMVPFQLESLILAQNERWRQA
jgi:hypothetical protein